MQYFLLGLAALALGLLLLRGFSRADVGVLARQIRTIGGVIALAAALAFLVRGMLSYAMPLAVLGSWLLWGGGALPGGNAQKTAGQTSRIVTDHLEMELDHDTGTMRGRVLKGQFANRSIESLSSAQLSELWQDCRFSDMQSATLIEAYLDSVHPSWREDLADADAARPGSGPGGAMSREEALQILGLKPDATKAEIRNAHRDLMLKLHPDRGGSDYLAAKINMAKDILLGD